MNGPEDTLRGEKRPERQCKELSQHPPYGKHVLGRDWRTNENAFRDWLRGFLFPEKTEKTPMGKGRGRQWSRGEQSKKTRGSAGSRRTVKKGKNENEEKWSREESDAVEVHEKWKRE
jgi:hypothetical protein